MRVKLLVLFDIDKRIFIYKRIRYRQKNMISTNVQTKKLAQMMGAPSKDDMLVSKAGTLGEEEESLTSEY